MTKGYTDADSAFFKRIYRKAGFILDSFRFYPKETAELRRVRYLSELWSMRYARRYGMKISFDTTVSAGMYSAILMLDEESDLRRDILRDVRLRNAPKPHTEGENGEVGQLPAKL